MRTLILTCTAKVHSNVLVGRNCSAERVTDYINAIDFWFAVSELDSIVVVDNSGFDFGELRGFYSPRVEFLSFDANGQYDPIRGKGFGEYLLLKHVCEHSNLIKDSTYVFKSTGRYTLKNANRLIRECDHSISIHADFSRNLSWVDSRFFGARKDFYFYALPYLAAINECEELHMEVCLARAAHAYLALGKSWRLLPDAPVFEGFYGADNSKYTKNPIKIYLKKALKLIKARAINIRY